MRYLRMLTNAAIGGALGTAFVTVLILQLNPQLPLRPDVVLPLYGACLFFYGAHLLVIFYTLIVFWQVFARELSPGWLSLGLLTWSGGALTITAATLMWLNREAYQSVLEAQ